MKATTDEDLRKAIEIMDEVSFPHPDQQWAIEQLCNAAHALGLLGMRYRRLKDRLSHAEKKPELTCDYGLPFHVADHDEDTQTWDEAMTLRENGWRLPTRDELNLIYQKKNIIPNLKNGWYWTSTELNASDAWCQRFSDGVQYNGLKGYEYDVRCVRNEGETP